MDQKLFKQMHTLKMVPLYILQLHILIIKECSMEKVGKMAGKLMKAFLPYFFLLLAVLFGTASNSFAKSAEGFSLVLPSLLSAITIILCMYGLSNVMKTVPIGVTYASFAGLCILATSLVGIFKFAQIPNLYTSIGLILIIAGVIIVNVFGVEN